MLGPADIRSSLKAAFDASSQLPPHVAAFVAWATRSQLMAMADTLREPLAAEGLGRHPNHCAALGYALHASCADGEIKVLFERDVEHLAGRQYFQSGRPLVFEVDGVALLGVGLGLAAMDEADASLQWFDSLTAEAERRLASDPWQTSLVQSARYALGMRTCLNPLTDDLKIAIMCRLGIEPTSDDIEAGWAMVATLPDHDNGPARDAARFAVIEFILERMATTPVSGMSVPDLVKVLEGVQRSMRLWTYETTSRTGKSVPRQWNIDHEYHVQNLLWTVLAPLFPTLEDELYLPSLGQKIPRADIGIPPLRTVVEVKFIRKRGKAAFTSVIEEIAADASLYRSEASEYLHVVAFIWDNLAQTEEHYELRSGLLKIDGLFDAIIISRPGRMNASGANEEP